MQLINDRIFAEIERMKQAGKIRFMREVAEAMHMQPQNFTAVMKGRKSFTVEQIYHFCHAYNIPPSRLFQYTQSHTQSMVS
jgi:transcriptional regulator with XRE-family HTH domain